MNMLFLMVHQSLFHNTLITMVTPWVAFWGLFIWQPQLMSQGELWVCQEDHLEYCYHGVKMLKSKHTPMRFTVS